MGVLRTKISELIAECGNLKAQSRNAHADQSTFLSYEKRYDIVEAIDENDNPSF